MAEGFLPFRKHLGVGGILADLVNSLLGVDADTYAVFALDVIEGILEALAGGEPSGSQNFVSDDRLFQPFDCRHGFLTLGGTVIARFRRVVHALIIEIRGEFAPFQLRMDLGPMGRRTGGQAGLFDALDPGLEDVEIAPAELLLDPRSLDKDRLGSGFDGKVDLFKHLFWSPMALRDPDLEPTAFLQVAGPELYPTLIGRAGQGGQATFGRLVENLHDPLVGVVALHLLVELGRLMGVSPEGIGAEDKPRNFERSDAHSGKATGCRRTSRGSRNGLRRTRQTSDGQRRSRLQEITSFHD